MVYSPWSIVDGQMVKIEWRMVGESIEKNIEQTIPQYSLIDVPRLNGRAGLSDIQSGSQFVVDHYLSQAMLTLANGIVIVFYILDSK
jgi:hypothetical protein